MLTYDEVVTHPSMGAMMTFYKSSHMFHRAWVTRIMILHMLHRTRIMTLHVLHVARIARVHLFMLH